jgi:hypothetical protein
MLDRDPAKRYQSADELLGELERYLYEPGFGPTNEKLGLYVREVVRTGGSAPSERAASWRRMVIHPQPRGAWSTPIMKSIQVGVHPAR